MGESEKKLLLLSNWLPHLTKGFFKRSLCCRSPLLSLGAPRRRRGREARRCLARPKREEEGKEGARGESERKKRESSRPFSFEGSQEKNGVAASRSLRRGNSVHFLSSSKQRERERAKLSSSFFFTTPLSLFPFRTHADKRFLLPQQRGGESLSFSLLSSMNKKKKNARLALYLLFSHRLLSLSLSLYLSLFLPVPLLSQSIIQSNTLQATRTAAPSRSAGRRPAAALLARASSKSHVDDVDLDDATPPLPSRRRALLLSAGGVASALAVTSVVSRCAGALSRREGIRIRGGERLVRERVFFSRVAISSSLSTSTSTSKQKQPGRLRCLCQRRRRRHHRGQGPLRRHLRGRSQGIPARRAAFGTQLPRRQVRKFSFFGFFLLVFFPLFSLSPSSLSLFSPPSPTPPPKKKTERALVPTPRWASRSWLTTSR